MSRELRVVDDLPGAAVDLFLEAEPRTVALSGGSTPRPVYERLAETPYPWDEVDVFFGDERCVPADHPDSNFAMANHALLSKVPARVHAMVACDPGGYEEALRSVFGDGVPRFDLEFLGLGEDGHTASLFPGDPALDVTDRLALLVERPDHTRMTLTLPVLSAARLAVFLVEGENKRGPLEQLLSDGDVPAARVAAGRVVVLADRAAAEGLPG
ncbi:MAG: 6-phosphogluconolactonase [Actinomycetota bacterium]|nr:6-phosphogluconolactonase [Actinomycetota bacterium]